MDERPLRKAINETHHPKGDDLSDRADPLGVDPWRDGDGTSPDWPDVESQLGNHDEPKTAPLNNPIDEPDTRIVVIDGDTAYLNVLALMMTLEVDDTPETRNIATLPVIAILKERGYTPVLIGIDE